MIKPQKLENDRMNFVSNFGKILGIIISVCVLLGFLAKPIFWPSKLQSEVTQLKADVAKIDADIRKDINATIEQVKTKVDADKNLINNNIDHLKEKVDKMDKMIEFLYIKNGGKK